MDSALDSITGSIGKKAVDVGAEELGDGGFNLQQQGQVQQEEQQQRAVDMSSLEHRVLDPDRFLYVELVRSHLGEAAASVLGLLVSLGRLSVAEIVQRGEEMDAAKVKRTLVALVQLRCVKYLEEVTYTGKKTMYYYHNTDGIHILLYSGMILEEIDKRFPAKKGADGDGIQVAAVTVVSNILALGSITLRDYLASLPEEQAHEWQHDISATFVSLCESGYITPINKLHYTPINDLWTLLYDKEYKLLPRNATTSDLKKRAEAKVKAKEQFFTLLDNANDLSNLIVTDPRTSLRTVSDSIPLTFNLERFYKARRSNQLAQFAKSRVGNVSAVVYKVALKHTEQKSVAVVSPIKYTGLLQDLEESRALQEELELAEEKTPGVTFTATDIVRHLPASLELRGSLTAKSKKERKREQDETTEEQPTKKKLKTEDGFVIPDLPAHVLQQPEEHEDNDTNNDHLMDFDDSGTDPHSITLVNSHLKLLATCPIPFLYETKPGVFYVPYSKVVPMMRSSVYDYLVASTLGASALRIRRCIKANKLASEKVINSTALMREKDIRSTTAALVKYNVSEIQEVPRTVDRAAARAVFLFRTKEDHSYRFMRENMEWNIANLLSKMERLKEENATLLTKANREDVRGKEAELLLPSELNQLKMVKKRDMTVYTRISRLVALWEVFNFM
ncbi:DNA-directed RNA polymerase III subunit C82 KNAG_0F04020 [Huiozyma naganishii CBS 8797]|uniref:DNA-directed RNA polymerase III subunit RPC3 n=1 Tax=Huiozyma naganishii (strain ATCC MYA-139 / BCRC 22969 / CBS 8797 / KCTC 17520 / NBRC 10181 / NCYC 3082 / Yp74L-3) TaxID=1071383 RepID=J7S8S3_HUIN7|nr:hypothetical protein KNAG_0F04020 [Kazachstania naganishii CBS 8797]CCK71066.1 hypothetical protein KNAG_0F04020 [Kazachstania naganishii CBS 8797]